MEHGILTQLGLAGILIYLFLKEMFAFLGKKKNGNGHDVQAIVHKESENLMAHIRLLLEARLVVQESAIRDPILKDLKETRHDMRTAIQEGLSREYLRRRDS